MLQTATSYCARVPSFS